MDVPVETGDGGEAAQKGDDLESVVGAPAPLRVHGEQRDVAEDHDGGVRWQSRQVLAYEVDPRVAEVPEFLQAQSVDQGDEGHVHVRRALEPDMAVGDLHEPQRAASRCDGPGGGPGVGVVGVRDVADHLSTGHGQDHRSAEPPCVPDELTLSHTVFGFRPTGVVGRCPVVGVVVVGHQVTSTVAVMNGWMVQR